MPAREEKEKQIGQVKNAPATQLVNECVIIFINFS